MKIARPILPHGSQGEVNFPLCLAPMVGLSHLALRALCRDYLPQGARTIWPTEMLSSRRLPFEDLKTVPETMRFESETHLVPQILGNEEKYIALSVARLEEWGAQAIDINMGCPVRKALRHNYGVALMGDPDYAWEVVRMTVKHTRLPVSVKLRAGGGGDLKFLIHFAQGLERAGAAWLAFHPRTVEQKRRGQADWSQIQALRAELSIPLIGNGDVQTAQDALRLMESTECDGAMAGRALTARPWMFWQLGEQLGWPPPPGREGQKAPQTPEEEGAEYGRSLLRFLSLLRLHFSEDLGLRKFRFYVRTGSVWLLFGNQLYALVMKAKTYEETEATLHHFFRQEQPMATHTELRQ